MSSLKEKLDAIKAMNDSIRADMIAAIKEALKDAIPDVTTISESPRCFTVKASTIFNDPFLRLCPSQYDIVEQRNAIIDVINNLDPEKALDMITELCETGKSRSRYLENVVFHPSVIERLQIAVNNL